MRHGYKVFDADGHVVEPKNLWERFLDQKFQHRVGWREVPGREAFRPATVDGRYTQSRVTIYGDFMEAVNWTYDNMREKYGQAVVDNGFPGDAVAEAMPLDGMDFMVIYGPGYDLWSDGMDPELQAAMCRAYNRWGQEMRETSGGRVIAAGPVVMNDVHRAVEEIQYAYDHLGTRCFFARPNLFNHRTLGDPYYDPMYELLQDLDCAFATHDFMGHNGSSAGADRFETFTEWHTVCHPHEAQMAMLSMICNGVFERFPRLRVAYMEANCAWLPWWLWRMEEHIELSGDYEKPGLTKSPQEYFQDNCFISVEPDEYLVYHVIEELGDDKIVWESDYPHPDSKYPEAVQSFLDLPKISDESKRKILWDNSLDLYRFPDGYLPDEFIEATNYEYDPASYVPKVPAGVG
ncbi:MAG: amidohydrolase [Acidimicrobiia bacterium]|nr:amidohydrolase [Acidimicrobiia bacterium]MYB73764.1 amidohydrolase [Acidimicrobiia bacterium]MYH99788.1 amidohydrolase [Acidimicrobiia bacterium]